MLYRRSDELTVCPSCGASPPRPLEYVTDKKNRTLVSGCDSCGLVFINPPPSTAEIEAYYQPGGGWERKLDQRKRNLVRKLEKTKNNPEHLRPGALAALFANEASVLRELYGARRVLDFGCGDGHILDRLQDAGWETAGVDPAAGHETARHTMLDVMPSEPSYDLVIMKHVLEHLIDPLSTLRAAHAALLDGGHLLVGVPTLDGLREHGKKRYCINRAHHLSAYTARSLRNLLALAGFSVVKHMELGVPWRMAVVARKGEAERVQVPLRDACFEFRQAAIAEKGRLCAMFPVRVRLALGT